MSPAHSNDLAAPSVPTSLPAAGDGVADKVADAMEKVSIQDEQHTHESLSGGPPQPVRPFITYSRVQCLALHKSPLVRLPDGMPPLKDWFGDWNEQVSSKKEPEPSTAPSTARDRRFRRDQEDGEPLPRATFRSGLSQPSQMGNFKHQSIRTTDRDRDRDGDKDRERDRDKEGHERLRSLSDKYDRDRLGLPATAANLRTRERDSAPHLTPGTSKLAAQSPLGPGAARRADGREAPRRKLETSEDWRRGRDDRADGLRRDRDDRDRPRSRVRDSSRNRRDPSPLRRDRDREDRDRYRGRDNDDHPRRKETKDDPPRRDRDHDRETTDDTRRWRDDGKREERLARRERDKDKDKGNGAGGEAAWDHDRPRDRDRWNIVDDREGRAKRQGGRERRAASREDRDKDERRDKDREREKEKEPAWMDTYIPASNSSGGILGGKLADGELDSIQTWKKGMKEKEQKEKLSEVGKGQAEGDSNEPGKSETTATTAPQMDEIQLFKMLMRREDDKKKLDAGSEGFADTPVASSPAPDPLFVALAKAKEQPGRSGTSIAKDAFERDTVSTATHGQSHASTQPSNSPAPHFTPESPSDGRRTLLSIVTPSTADHAPPGAPKPSTPLESPQVVGSRFFPNPSPSEGSSVQNQLMEKTASGLIKSPIPAQFNPPPGSRLLSFGSRTPSVTSSAKGLASVNPPPGLSQPPQQQPGMHSLTSSPFLSDISRMGSENDMLNGSMRGPTIDISRSQRGFSPFDHQARSSYSLEDQEAYAHAEALRRQSVVSMGERSQFGIPSESASPYSDLSGVNPMTGQGLRLANHSPSFDGPLSSNGPGGSQYPQPKGSRFAKFFDGKTRDAQASGMVKGQNIIGHSSPSPLAVRRHETGSTNDIFNVANGDGRTMEDIFAMLQSSTQGQRLNNVNTLNQLSSVNNGSYGQAPSNMHTVHHPQQNFTPARNLDVLYDNRLDDRNFVPDGMVPGLRSIPPPRRENLFHDQIDDSMAFSVHSRLQPQRNMDQMYPSPSQMQSLYLHQASNQRNAGLPPQQPFRNGTSPIPVQNPQLQVIPQQRLPPGLANLGGRPPHEPSQFLGSPMGMSSGGIPGNGPTPPFNNFSGNAGYSAGPQMRGPPPGPHQLQNPLGHNPMVGLGHPNKMDLRGGPAQAQLLGMGGGVVVGSGLRGPGSGFGPQQGPNAQLQAQHQAQQLTMRQQQQQLPPHMMPHLLPPHLQQQGPPGATSQPAHDIMALLMGGPPRN